MNLLSPEWRLWLFRSAVVILAALLLNHYTLGPRRRQVNELTRQTQELRQSIAAARATVQTVKAQEQAASAVRFALRQRRQTLPSGEIIAWFPTRMKDHFAQMGIANAVTRLNTEFAEPNMPGFQRTYWAVDLPLPGSRSDMSRLLIAVAALEETDSIAKIMDLAIRTEDSTGHRTAIMNVSALTEK
jgi:hypothetical protein